VIDDFLSYLGASPTPFHAVAEAKARLVAAGFTELDEKAPWSTQDRVGKRFITFGGATLIAFVNPSEAPRAFRIIGAHTDSPNLRLKPKAEYSHEGYNQLGVEVYGGVLLNSWLDRDLGLAGRVFVRGEGGALREQLIDIREPWLRVPQLAIHLDREVNDKGLALNKQEHLAPIWGLQRTDAASLLQRVADRAGVALDALVAHELMLFDLTAPQRGGADGEFVFSARLDNLAMCHAGLAALLAASTAPARDVQVVALFDHEEIGSESATGAASAILPRVLERLCPSREVFLQALAHSSCVSADMAHAVHPNYASRHEPRHKPVVNGGPVIKVNAQQRYATSPRTAAMFAEHCQSENISVQHYAHRTDLPCGSTIGPITANLLGIPTVDVGNPMLSMHSAREMCGAKDPDLMTRVMARYLSA
jgi:aspartyl aminopeptidase